VKKTNIHDKLDALTKGISAYHIADQTGNAYARVVVKHMTACHVFTHTWGHEPRYHQTRGYGFDRVHHAMQHGLFESLTVGMSDEDKTKALASFNGGATWQNALRSVGYQVQHVL
jgi:hypothetical protein